MRRNCVPLREALCLLRILERCIWLEQAIDQFSFLFLCARRNHLKQKRHNEQANTHAPSLQGDSRIVKKNARSRASRKHLVVATALCRRVFQRRFVASKRFVLIAAQSQERLDRARRPQFAHSSRKRLVVATTALCRRGIQRTKYSALERRNR